MNMYGIKNETTCEYIIQKSKFIAILYPIESVEDISQKLGEVKHQYPNATHYCYAYICDSSIKANDDGEPSGTAGSPILNILENRELNHVLCIVVRYFGGIKLGAPGLVRAYGKATRLVIDQAEIGHRIASLVIESVFTYENLKQLNYLLKDENMLSQSWDEYITFQYMISEEKWELLKHKLHNITISTKIIKNIYQII